MADAQDRLFRSVFLSMRLPRLFSVVSGMDRMAARSVSMVGGFLVLSRLVMLGSFSMMTGGMSMILRSFTMMISRFLRHPVYSAFMLVHRPERVERLPR